MMGVDMRPLYSINDLRKMPSGDLWNDENIIMDNNIILWLINRVLCYSHRLSAHHNENVVRHNSVKVA